MQPPDSRDATGVWSRVLHGQGGFMAGGEALLFGSLIFIFGVMLSINAWGVMDSRMTADAVAQQVARTLVEADGQGGLAADLRGVARAVADDMGRIGTPVTLAYLGPDGAAVSDPGRLLVRCQRVTVEATLETNTVHLPFVNNDWGVPWAITGSHTEIVDPFRSGLPGEADCRG